MTLTVKPLTPDYAALYADLRLMALAEYPHHFTTSSLAAESALSPADWEKKLNDGQYYGAFLDEQLVAILEAKIEGSHAQLRGVFTPQKGCGFGRALVKGTLEMLAVEGVATCSLTVPETNPMAFAFYEALGFEPQGHYVQKGVGKTTYGVNLLSAPSGAASLVFQQNAEFC